MYFNVVGRDSGGKWGRLIQESKLWVSYVLGF